jgi:hypothetical protein
MSNIPKPFSHIHNYDISNVAIFESRRFERNFQQNYVFILKDYLRSEFDNHHASIRTTYSPILPIIEKKDLYDIYLELSFCKQCIGNDNYCLLLAELLHRCSTYDHVNILFQYLTDQKHFTEVSINKIIELGINNRIIRNSFEAQRDMIHLIYVNRHLIEGESYRSILNNFPFT